MITRDGLIHAIGMALAEELVKQQEKGKIDTEVLATLALDTVMDKVADPLCGVLESASPFGAIAADQIRAIAGRS